MTVCREEKSAILLASTDNKIVVKMITYNFKLEPNVKVDEFTIIYSM